MKKRNSFYFVAPLLALSLQGCLQNQGDNYTSPPLTKDLDLTSLFQNVPGTYQSVIKSIETDQGIESDTLAVEDLDWTYEASFVSGIDLSSFERTKEQSEDQNVVVFERGQDRLLEFLNAKGHPNKLIIHRASSSMFESTSKNFTLEFFVSEKDTSLTGYEVELEHNFSLIKKKNSFRMKAVLQ